MKKYFLTLMLTILLVGSSYAISFEKNPISNIIVPQLNHSAQIELKILDAPKGDYKLYSMVDVNLYPEEYFKIDSDERIVLLTITPKESLKTRGNYRFVYSLYSSSERVNYDDRMTVKVVDFKDLFDVYSEQNYPSETLTFFVKNKENISLKGISASFSSLIFETEETFDLEPFEIKEITTRVDMNKLNKIPAGSYLIESVFKMGEVQDSIQGKIYLGEKKEIKSESSKKGFFIRTVKEKKTNSGNTLETVRVSMTKNLFSIPVTFFNIKPTETKTSFGKKEYIWILEIDPADEIEIISKTNYLIFLVILLIAGGLITFLLKQNSKKLIIKKSVSPVKTKGGEFALRVKLHLKAVKDLENVSLLERIPPIVKVHEKFGTVKPTSINLKERKLKWELGTMKQGDERVFSYVVYSKLGVLGKFTLPEAVGFFEEQGNLFESFSNKVFFISEQIKK